MELNRSAVHRGLDVRVKIGGMEALDLIAALIALSILNVLHLPLPIVVCVPVAMLLVLYLGKRNKPDGFLLHLLRFYLTPGHYAAGAQPEFQERLRTNIYEK